MKQKFNTIKAQSGFTIIELLVVIAIMGTLSAAVIVNFNQQRVSRNATIAKNETVTNIRKVQNYMLSSKNIDTGLPAKFYLLTFTKNSSTYFIQAIDNGYVFHDPKDAGAKNPLETVQLPGGITIGELSIGKTNYNCLQIIFSAPFGKMYTKGGLNCGSSIASTVQDPILLSQLNENETLIQLANSGTLLNHYITLTPITGLVTPN